MKTAPGAVAAQRFETFVGGAATRLPMAASRAVAESPRPPYNPLLLCGPPGLGKSHLLAAASARAAEVNPSRSILRTTATTFTDDALACAEADLLLVDDLETIGAVAERASALADLLERRMAAGRATILAVDCLPADIPGFDPRLARLAASGLVAELSLPDQEQRRGILQRLAESAEPPIRDDVLEMLAALPVTSIRELAGALRRLTAFQTVSQIPLDVKEATVLLTGLVPDESAADLDVDDERDEPIEVPDTAPDPDGEEAPSTLATIDGTGLDEFGDFLSEVAATVADQVDRWRSRVGDAILRWEAEGIRTAALERLLREEFPAEPDAVLADFERQVHRLREIAAEIGTLVPERAGDPMLRDPAQVGAAERLLEEVRLAGLAFPEPRSGLRLEGLEEGPANRAALRAARLVVAEPGSGQNPLVITGPSGTGKTHLLHGIANALIASGLRRVAALDPAQFLDDVSRGATDSYHHAQAVLLDGLESLRTEEAGQRVLVELVDAWLGGTTQVVVTCVEELDAVEGLDNRLRTRLGGGLAVRLAPPDRDIRMRILRRLLAGGPEEEDAALLDYLASRPADSVPAVEGMLRRLRSEAEAQGAPLSQALAREVLEAPPPRPQPTRPPRSGIASTLLGGTRSREKLVEVWPTIGDRLVEEFR